MGCQTASPNYLQKDLLVLTLNFPLVIFAWCTWCNPSILYQTILLHCWNSHLPPSTCYCLFTLVTCKGTSQETQHAAASAVQKQNKKNQSLPQWVNCSDELNLQHARQETRNKHWGLEGEAFQSYKTLSTKAAHATVSQPLQMPLSVTMLFPGPSVSLPAIPKIKFMDGRLGLWTIFFWSPYSSSPGEAPCFWQVHSHSSCPDHLALAAQLPVLACGLLRHLPPRLSFHCPCSHWHSPFPLFL